MDTTKVAAAVLLACALATGCRGAVSAAMSPTTVTATPVPSDSTSATAEEPTDATRETAPAILEQLDDQLKSEPGNGLLWARRFQAHYAAGDKTAALADLDQCP